MTAPSKGFDFVQITREIFKVFHLGDDIAGSASRQKATGPLCSPSYKEGYELHS